MISSLNYFSLMRIYSLKAISIPFLKSNRYLMSKTIYRQDKCVVTIFNNIVHLNTPIPLHGTLI
jgi:hypothetical protein